MKLLNLGGKRWRARRDLNPRPADSKGREALDLTSPPAETGTFSNALPCRGPSIDYAHLLLSREYPK